MKDREVQEALLRDAGGARPASDVDALIERLNDFSCGRGCFDTLVGDCREAAAALVQLRDSEALARGKIAKQTIEIERLKANQRCSAIEQGEVGYPCVFRAEAEAEVARLKQWQVDMVAKAADKSLDGYRELGAKCAALEAERDALRQKLDGILKAYDAYRARGMIPAPNQYALLVAAIDAARAKEKP